MKTRKISSLFSDWTKLFTNWYKQNNTIIQFPDILFQIYPTNYHFQEKELNAWRAMLRASGCTNITPFTKKQYMIEFWTSLQKALEINKRGIDGKIRILSIIAEDFTYKKLKEKLKVSFFYH